MTDSRRDENRGTAWRTVRILVLINGAALLD